MWTHAPCTFGQNSVGIHLWHHFQQIKFLTEGNKLDTDIVLLLVGYVAFSSPSGVSYPLLWCHDLTTFLGPRKLFCYQHALCQCIQLRKTSICHCHGFHLFPVEFPKVGRFLLPATSPRHHPMTSPLWKTRIHQQLVVSEFAATIVIGAPPTTDFIRFYSNAASNCLFLEASKVYTRITFTSLPTCWDFHSCCRTEGWWHKIHHHYTDHITPVVASWLFQDHLRPQILSTKLPC